MIELKQQKDTVAWTNKAKQTKKVRKKGVYYTATAALFRADSQKNGVGLLDALIDGAFLCRL